MNLARCLVLLLVLFAARAAADAAPPPGKKIIPITTYVETEEEFPEYVLFTITRSKQLDASLVDRPSQGEPRSSAPPPVDAKGLKLEPGVTLVSIPPGRSIQRTGVDRENTILYAVPRSAVEEYGGLVRVASVMQTTSVQGAVQLTFGSLLEVPSEDSRTEITYRYRLQRSPYGNAEFMRTDRLPVLVVDTPEGPPEPVRTKRSPLAVAGAAATVGMILAGLWLVSRTRRLSPSAPATPAGSRSS